MKLAIAGDSAGEGLAKVLADHLKDRFEVSEISRTDEGPDAFYANLSDRVASQVMDGTYDRAILVCGTGIGVCIAANKVPGFRPWPLGWRRGACMAIPRPSSAPMTAATGRRRWTSRRTTT